MALDIKQFVHVWRFILNNMYMYGLYIKQFVHVWRFILNNMYMYGALY